MLSGSFQPSIGGQPTGSIFMTSRKQCRSRGGRLILTRKAERRVLEHRMSSGEWQMILAREEFWTLEVISWIIPGPRQDGPVGRGRSSLVEHDLSLAWQILALLVKKFYFSRTIVKAYSFQPFSFMDLLVEILPFLIYFFFNLHDPYSFSSAWIWAVRGLWDLEVLSGGSKDIES